MSRPINSKNKKLSKERLYDLSLETIEMAMVYFIAKIKSDTLTQEQKYKLAELYDNFIKIQESK